MLTRPHLKLAKARLLPATRATKNDKKTARPTQLHNITKKNNKIQKYCSSWKLFLLFVLTFPCGTVRPCRPTPIHYASKTCPSCSCEIQSDTIPRNHHRASRVPTGRIFVCLGRKTSDAPHITHITSAAKKDSLTWVRRGWSVNTTASALSRPSLAGPPARGHSWRPGKAAACLPRR